MDDFIQVDGAYVYKGKEYCVTKYEPGVYLVKDADSGNWHDAVEYTSEETSKTFVRQAEDFRAKFVA